MCVAALRLAELMTKEKTRGDELSTIGKQRRRFSGGLTVVQIAGIALVIIALIGATLSR